MNNLTEPMNLVEEAHDILNAIADLERIFDDQDKVAAWLGTPNPNLGGAIPLHLIIIGRGRKVLKFIENAIEENGYDDLE